MADPVTEQIATRTDWQRAREDPAELRDVAQRLVEDAVGNRIPFGALYKEQKTIVIFLRVREAPGLAATTQLGLPLLCQEKLGQKVPKRYAQGKQPPS